MRRPVGLLLTFGLLIAAAACSSGNDEFSPSPTRDPDRIAAQEAAERWISTYAGGLLVDESAEMYLTDQEQGCVTTAIAEELDPATAEAIADAASTDQLDAAARDQLVEVLETCSDLEQFVYEFLVEELYDAGTANCMAQTFVLVVSWADLLSLAPRAANGEVDRTRMIAWFRDQMAEALRGCIGPDATLPY